jgi:hypothetical protein
VVVVVAVAATKLGTSIGATLASVALSFLAISLPAQAGELPEERADLMYHSYNGGGMEITGPSLLVRKNFLEKISVSANYYVDNVSSASVDVESYASPYTEERTEQSLGLDFLNNKTTMSLGFTTSEESDYDAETAYFGVSQDFFGDLTTLSMGYSQGDDEVRRNERNPGSDEIVDSIVMGNVDRQNYRINLSQVLTKNLVASFGFETITDEGYLNNPYRQVRFLTDTGVGTATEVYPNTRTSDAAAIRAMYYLPWRASLRGEYRTFVDTWGIDGTSIEFRYVHPWDDNWTFEFKLRQYEQTGSDFFSDLFPRENAQNFLARDKEMSSFSSWSVGFGGSYTLNLGKGPFELVRFNLFIDHMEFEYDEFRDIPTGREQLAATGSEPFYSFSADVARLFVTVTY